jgi:serine protease Do
MFRPCTVGFLAVSAFFALGAPVDAQEERFTPMVKAIQKAEPSVVGIFFVGKEKVNGTGIIIDKRGIIVTNSHVVEKARQVVVHLHDGPKVNGDVILVRPDVDLAFVRINVPNDLPAVPPKEHNKDNKLLRGETVIAIGHPYGYEDTVSAGIVSALGRQIEEPNGVKLINLIQTNADINPGNSGGPLLNIYGELIGINVAVREGANGIAFSIPADTVIRVINETWKKTK